MYYLTKDDYVKAEKNGISHQMLYNRYYRLDYDLERAITEKPGSYARTTTNMKLWEEWGNIAESNGVDKQTFYNRLNTKSKMKWTPKEAATIPKGLRRGVTITPTIRKLAKHNGINVYTLRNRVYNQHWTPYRAATEPVHRYEAMFEKIEEVLV